jgi:hypothetical protein
MIVRALSASRSGGREMPARWPSAPRWEPVARAQLPDLTMPRTRFATCSEIGCLSSLGPAKQRAAGVAKSSTEGSERLTGVTDQAVEAMEFSR